ncbi:MAG TPA: c-type cytochrome [Bryobacteraceae bacterium]|nr:c-type cytochrome [Bryobacteraceae bacterium]
MCGNKLAGLVLLLCVPLTAGQHGSDTSVNPYTGPQHAMAGAKLFRAQCAGCHGPDGAGTGAGPGLNSGIFRRGSSDEAIFQTISKGVAGTSMPGFSFSGLQIWELVTHIRALSIAHGASHTKGNSQLGAALFRANCAACHSIGEQGGLSGPDLTTVGLRLSGVALQIAIVDPNANVSSEFWSVAVRTISGRKLIGVRLNEDTHSIQIRDERGQLMSVLRRDIADSELIRESPMPSFTGKLSATQIEDLVAYLIGLRGKQ